MNQDNNLFDLIQSLTINEKGYFKKQASLHTIGKVNNYVVLFDAIAKQKEYSEQKTKLFIKKNFRSNNVSDVKKYLYNMILKSLDLYYYNSSVKISLKKLLRYAELLFSKALYSQCEKILHKAEKEALYYEHFDILLEICNLRLKSRVAKSDSFKNMQESDISTLYQEQNALLKKMTLEVKYFQLNASFFFTTRKVAFARGKGDIGKYNQIINHPLFKDGKEATTLRSKFIFYNTHGLYYSILQNPQKSFINYNRSFQIYEEQPELIKDSFNNYLSVFSNLILFKIQLKEFDTALDLVSKLEKIEVKGMHLEAKIFSLVHLRKLYIFNQTLQFKKGQLLIPKVEKGLKKYAKQISLSDSYHFCYNIASLYFILGEFKKAAFWLNKIIVETNQQVGLDLQAFARILNLIAHFEMKNWEHLHSIIRSTYLFLKKRSRLFEFESILLKYLKKLQNIGSESNLTKLFAEFKNEISILQNNPQENAAFQYFDFISWLESKIEKKSVEEILIKKSNHSKK